MIYHLLKHNLDSWRSSISSDPLRWCICNFERTGRHSDIWNYLNQRRDHLYCLVILTVSDFLKDWLFDDWTVINVKVKQTCRSHSWSVWRVTEIVECYWDHELIQVKQPLKTSKHWTAVLSYSAADIHYLDIRGWT